MSSTFSKVQRGAHGSVDWHIDNWTTDFALLKKFANCTLIIPNNDGNGRRNTVEIRFSFFEYGNNVSLCGQHVSGGRPPMAISVDLETTSTNPSSFTDKQCIVDTIGGTFTVQEAFIFKTNTLDQSGRRVTDFPKHQQLNFKITVTILNFNKTELLTESVEGAMGGACSFAEASMLKDIKLMFNAEENYSDLKIETKDNMTLSGHRFILAARSPGFRKLIDEQVKKEGFSGVVKVTDVNAKPLVVVLHWMYTGELHENAGKVMEDVMKICVAFEIPALLKILDKKLITICNIQNMFQLFQAAQQHGLHTAKEAISTFIKENIESI